jgi:hypothetical protein
MAMINIQTETLRLLTRAHQDVPSRPHWHTPIRWWQRGVRGIHLESVLIGGRRYTSAEAIARFLARVAATDEITDEAADCTLPSLAGS